MTQTNDTMEEGEHDHEMEMRAEQWHQHQISVEINRLRGAIHQVQCDSESQINDLKEQINYLENQY